MCLQRLRQLLKAAGGGGGGWRCGAERAHTAKRSQQSRQMAVWADRPRFALAGGRRRRISDVAKAVEVPRQTEGNTGAQTQTHNTAFLCAVLGSSNKAPASPSARFMSIALNLCWTAAQQAGEKPFCSRCHGKRQGRICGGRWGWGG